MEVNLHIRLEYLKLGTLIIYCSMMALTELSCFKTLTTPGKILGIQLGALLSVMDTETEVHQLDHCHSSGRLEASLGVFSVA